MVIVEGIVTCVCLIAMVILAIIYIRKMNRDEEKTNKAKRTMYNAWYDLAILYADIKNKELENKEK